MSKIKVFKFVRKTEMTDELFVDDELIRNKYLKILMIEQNLRTAVKEVNKYFSVFISNTSITYKKPGLINWFLRLVKKGGFGIELGKDIVIIAHVRFDDGPKRISKHIHLTNEFIYHQPESKLLEFVKHKVSEKFGTYEVINPDLVLNLKVN